MVFAEDVKNLNDRLNDLSDQLLKLRARRASIPELISLDQLVGDLRSIEHDVEQLGHELEIRKSDDDLTSPVEEWEAQWRELCVRMRELDTQLNHVQLRHQREQLLAINFDDNVDCNAEIQSQRELAMQAEEKDLERVQNVLSTHKALAHTINGELDQHVQLLNGSADTSESLQYQVASITRQAKKVQQMINEHHYHGIIIGFLAILLLVVIVFL